MNVQNPVSTSSSLPSMIDTHCHLDDDQFAQDLDDVLAASRAANVTRWILIGYKPSGWQRAIEMTRRIEGMYASLGIHPSHAAEWSDASGETLRALAVADRVVAIGEAGLDFYRDNAPYPIQRAAFEGQLRLAHDLDLPLVIHMRDAEAEMIEVLSAVADLPRLVFHSFDGSARLLDFARERDAMIGIGGLATRQNSATLRDLLSSVPVERLLTETDSPYLVPARQKDRRNQPRHIATIVEMLAPTLQMTPSELADRTTQNARDFFRI